MGLCPLPSVKKINWKNNMATGPFNYSKEKKVNEKWRNIVKDGKNQAKDGKKIGESHASWQ